MDAKTESLIPADELAGKTSLRFPNESAEYRAARTELLAAEIELRRHLERVAAQRRALPPGGLVTGDYRFEGEEGETDFAGLFAGKDTLVAHSYMFGPQRERPCPMCTNMLNSWESNAADIGQNVSLVAIARSPYEKLKAWKAKLGWKRLRLYTDLTGAFSRDYNAMTPDGLDDGVTHVFTLRDGSIRHFWSQEMTPETADPGQDVRGAPESTPLWNVLDLTPRGRDPDWYPSLSYD